MMPAFRDFEIDDSQSINPEIVDDHRSAFGSP
jgi:hypothetical protein